MDFESTENILILAPTVISANSDTQRDQINFTPELNPYVSLRTFLVSSFLFIDADYGINFGKRVRVLFLDLGRSTSAPIISL